MGASILFLPLIGFVIAGILSLYASKNNNNAFLNNLAWFFTTILVGTATLLAFIMLLEVIKSEQPIIFQGRYWFVSGNFFVPFSITFNILTTVMTTLVCLISFLVHGYSYFYISKNDNLARFQSYLSLFTFSMLLLLLSDNLVQMFIGWEAISFCSYLLIAYWFKESIPNEASAKAFLINRFADIGFLLGIFATFILFGSIQFNEILPYVLDNTAASFEFLNYDFSLLTLISLLFLLSAFAKSAQILLHIWLPSAMVAPTPVSALLHAATMVTAGIFIVVKLAPIFQQSLFILDVILIVSAITVLYGAVVACFQHDIKKIIAYSTISQLAYMFLSIGVNSYNGAIFHLFTHAFFKALLFLCAGSVIHAMQGEQDIRKMGNLWRKIPVTYVCMFIGSLALIGVPGFSGFYSKEVILNSLLTSNSYYSQLAFYSAIITIMFTTIYSLRLIFIVFHGKENYSENIKVHESLGMLLVLILLAFFSVMVGSFVYDNFIGEKALIFWKGSLLVNDILMQEDIQSVLKYSSLTMMLIGVIFVYVLYMRDDNSKKVSKMFPTIYKTIGNNFYFDYVYSNIIVASFNKLGKLFTKVDDDLIDHYGPNTLAGLFFRLSRFLSRSQTGYINLYATVMVSGLFLTLLYCFFFFKDIN